MTNAEKALQYFIIAVPENKEQAEAYVWARRALNAAIRAERADGESGSMLTNADLLARAEAAEAGAEKAEKERDAAIEDMRGICYLCANAKPYSALSRTVMTCAHKEYTASTKYPECKYFKWRGQKEE